MTRFLKNNINFFVFLFFAVIIELSTVFVITDFLFLTKPWFILTMIGVIFSIYNLLKKRILKNALLSICLCIQSILCLFNVILYENTGTLFDFSMFSLVGETSKFMGSIDINYGFIVYLIACIFSFVFITGFLNKYQDKYYRCKLSLITSIICLVCSILSQVSIIICSNKISEERFKNMLYVDSNDKYHQLGPTGNFFNEIYKKLFFNKYNSLSIDEIEDYIYSNVSSPSEYFGISKENNLVTILVESLEWFAFINDPSIYPNGANISEDTLDTLFPNLRRFYNESVVANNHYSQNKTDISEDEALIGAYPSNDYINYGFADNTLATSIATSIKLNDDSVSTNFFHNNERGFYNRFKISTNMGYENLYFIEEMTKFGVTNYMDSNNLVSGARMNLDSEMIDKMKELMFPNDKRFVTHITSISMHGDYQTKRDNLQKWYDKLDSFNVTAANSLKNYLASVMEFDYALGLIFEYLESNNLLENTTIVLFSDHNTYMSDLTYLVKGIGEKEYSKENYTELFRVPLMIYDENIGHKVINDFSTTYDIAPTILDLFGINYYTNLYYGNSIFNDTYSILYSRAFGVFITDKIFFSNINSILYKDKSVDYNYIKAIETKCVDIVKKLYYTNHIFYYNYFSNNLDNYKSNFLSINEQ